MEILAALAHETRLEAFRRLVRAGPSGLPAGRLADDLGLGATALSFHLNRMRQAGLVRRRRAGAQSIYSANFSLMGELRSFLDAACCADVRDGCGPDCGAAEPAQATGKAL